MDDIGINPNPRVVVGVVFPPAGFDRHQLPLARGGGGGRGGKGGGDVGRVLAQAHGVGAVRLQSLPERADRVVGVVASVVQHDVDEETALGVAFDDAAVIAI